MDIEIEDYRFSIYKCYDCVNNEVLCYSLYTPDCKDYPRLEYCSSAMKRIDNDRIFNGALRFMSHMDIPQNIKAYIINILSDTDIMKIL